MADRSGVERDDLAQLAMLLVWGAFTLAYLVFFYIFRDAKEIADASLDGYLEVILLGIPTIVVLAGVMWMHDSEVEADILPRVVGWTLGLASLFVVAIYAVMFVVEVRFDPGERWLILLMAAGFGASVGTVTGIVEARSQQRERERRISRERARRTERERTQLEYLNHYLRHEVLNEVQKIGGAVSLLRRRGDYDETSREYLNIVRDSSDEIAVFIDSIRTVLDASDHDPDLSTVDLPSVLESEVQAAMRTHKDVRVDLDAPASAPIRAGSLVNRVFRNLIENAIQHNEGPVSITISVTAREQWVTVRIRDDGDGIVGANQDRLFEPPQTGNHGYGLHLTRNLVSVYDGQIELEETGAHGTVFVVRFRTADPPEVPTGAPRSKLAI